jgi:hypothetical protein
LALGLSQRTWHNKWRSRLQLSDLQRSADHTDQSTENRGSDGQDVAHSARIHPAVDANVTADTALAEPSGLCSDRTPTSFATASGPTIAIATATAASPQAAACPSASVVSAVTPAVDPPVAVSATAIKPTTTATFATAPSFAKFSRYHS